MPKIDPAVQAAADRAQRRATARANQPEPQPSVLSDAELGENCCDYGDPSPEDPVLKLGRTMRSGSKIAASKIQQDVTRARRNPTENSAKLKIVVGDLAQAAATKQLGFIDESISFVERRISEMDAEIHSLIQPPTNELRALVPEVRGVLRGMPEKERDQLLSKTDSDDFDVLMYAVASAPAWMSGVVEGQKKEITTTILALRRPQLISLPPQYRKELELLKRCRVGFERSINQMVDFEAVEALRSLVSGAE